MKAYKLNLQQQTPNSKTITEWFGVNFFSPPPKIVLTYLCNVNAISIA